MPLDPWTSPRLRLPRICFTTRWSKSQSTVSVLKMQEDPNVRFETVCLGCPAWDECSKCAIAYGTVTPTCEVPLEHTSADEDGLTFETLKIDEGYWRATTESVSILACYNADACAGGKTGADSFCSSGYQGPCEREVEDRDVRACL